MLRRGPLRSLLTGHAAYIRLANTVSDDELYLQLKYDTDAASRFLTYLTLIDREMNKLCQDPEYHPSDCLVSWYLTTLSDNTRMQNTGALTLTIFEYASDPAYAHQYTLLHQAKHRFLKGRLL